MPEEFKKCCFNNPKSITCSDIEIAMAQTPKDVQLLANEIGLLTDEIDMYGKKKAKVSLNVLKRLQDQASGKYVVVTGYFFLLSKIFFFLNKII